MSEELEAADYVALYKFFATDKSMKDIAKIVLPLLIKQGYIKSEDDFDDFMMAVDVTEKLDGG